MPRGSYRPGASALLKNTVLSLPFLDLIRVRRQCRRKYPPAAAAHVYPFSLRWAAALACPFCLCQLRLLAGRARLPAPSPSAGSLSVSTGGACLPACSPRLATLALSSTTALRSRSPSATPLATKSTHVRPNHAAEAQSKGARAPRRTSRPPERGQRGSVHAVVEATEYLFLTRQRPRNRQQLEVLFSWWTIEGEGESQRRDLLLLRAVDGCCSFSHGGRRRGEQSHSGGSCCCSADSSARFRRLAAHAVPLRDSARDAAPPCGPLPPFLAGCSRHRSCWPAAARRCCAPAAALQANMVSNPVFRYAIASAVLHTVQQFRFPLGSTLIC